VQTVERLTQQTRDLHLRDADSRGDLALGHVVDEAHLEDSLLALGQVSESRAQQRAHLGELIALLGLAERVDERRVALVVMAGGRGERQRRAVGERAERLDDGLEVGPGALGELAGGGGAAGLGLDRLGRRADLERQLLRPAGDVDAPAGVAEVTQQLADDRRLRERRERVPAIGVEAVDGLDQADGGDLHEVVEALAAAAIAAGERSGERQVFGDQGLAGL
jgi:hypothetical protein